LLRGLVFAWVAFFMLSGTAQAWWNNDWTLRKKITVDTGATGGAVSDPIGTTPILIRLSGDFNFEAAKQDGSDIRLIAADDKTPLAYHIEKFDPLLGEAFVWVKVPDLKPGAPTTLWLYYGNTGDKTAPGAADVKGTYDADMVLVYHFAETGVPVHDSTASGNDAQDIGKTTDGSLIGPGLKLDGHGAISIPASASLAWTDGGTMTWSAWVKMTALQPSAVIFTRRDDTKYFIIGFDNGAPFVEVTNGARSQGSAALPVNTWHHLAVVASGGTITLYVDGAVSSTLGAALPGLNSLSVLGGVQTVGSSFNGELDELEISKVARPPGFIKVAALGQGADSAKLLTLAQDEAPPAGWLSGAFGLFGVILKSVTIDGWVVIGILGIMSVVSWYVMVSKLFYLLIIEKGNALFLAEWKHIALDLTVLDHGAPERVRTLGGRAGPKILKLIRNSTLYRVYHVGAEEIALRMANNRILSTRSIQAIRASLDGSYVRENHALNSGMVFLTISIAGGPFMGLLGTVIGVMITFAAIAATGEVNISAIAPGLAAALVATVAGLLVAIPALLGYNYLTSRMKTVTSDMQIFIDEFVTKMAEFYQPDHE
jgi:biopolymer transport protein ExbB